MDVADLQRLKESNEACKIALELHDRIAELERKLEIARGALQECNIALEATWPGEYGAIIKAYHEEVIRKTSKALEEINK